MALSDWVRPHTRLDLHLHSSLSDGRLNPQDLLRECTEAGLDCIALTDHDLPPSIKSGRNVVGKRAIHVIHGVELSGAHEDREFHLLVYFPEAMPGSFQDFCRDRAMKRAVRYENARKKLSIPSIPEANEAARTGQRSLTRFHLAQALVDSKTVPSKSVAFEQYLSRKHGLFPPLDLSFVDAISAAREAGGICSWAHPSWEDALSYTPVFAEAGLQGLEALRPTVKKKLRKRFERLAQQHGLFLTGGSDWHGWNRSNLGQFFINGEQGEGFLQALEATTN